MMIMIVNFDLVCQLGERRPVIDNCQQYEECRYIQEGFSETKWVRFDCKPHFFDSISKICTWHATCFGKFYNVNLKAVK